VLGMMRGGLGQPGGGGGGWGEKRGKWWSWRTEKVGHTRSRRHRGRRFRWRSEVACTMTEPWRSGSSPVWKT